MSHDGRFVVRGVNLTSYAFAKHTGVSDNNSEGKSGPHISIPLAFKSIMSRSTENLLSDEKTGPSVMSGTSPTLSECQEFGILIPDTTPCGMVIRANQNRQLQGIVWSHEEIIVRHLSGICCHESQSFSDV